MELVGEQFRTFYQQRQIPDVEDTDSLDPFPVALPVKRPPAPVLEACEEWVVDRVRFWDPCQERKGINQSETRRHYVEDNVRSLRPI